MFPIRNQCKLILNFYPEWRPEKSRKRNPVLFLSCWIQFIQKKCNYVTFTTMVTAHFSIWVVVDVWRWGRAWEMDGRSFQKDFSSGNWMFPLTDSTFPTDTEYSHVQHCFFWVIHNNMQSSKATNKNVIKKNNNSTAIPTAGVYLDVMDATT